MIIRKQSVGLKKIFTPQKRNAKSRVEFDRTPLFGKNQDDSVDSETESENFRLQANDSPLKPLKMW